MTTSIEAIVKPELLVWARENSRLDPQQAARKLQVSMERLQEWESGERRPTVAQLRRMTEVYKRPLAVFYLPEPPKTFDAMRITDFRTLVGGAGTAISSGLATEIRIAYRRREIALSLSDELKENIGEFSIQVSSADDAEKVAERIRAYLGVSLQEQFAWRDPYSPLNAWRSVVEAVGVLVFQTERVPLDEMRGLSISEEILPLILINGADSPRAKVFTLFHEFTHLVLRVNAMCDFREGHRLSATADSVEVFSNRVAGAVLVPKVSLLQEPLVAAKDDQQCWSDEEIRALASKYSVSDEALLRRLVILGVASEDFYRTKRDEYLTIYNENKEKKKEQGGFAPHHKIVLRRNGLRYTRLVLSAYYDHAITASDVSDYLNVNLKHLHAIEQEAF